MWVVGAGGRWERKRERRGKAAAAREGQDTTHRLVRRRVAVLALSDRHRHVPLRYEAEARLGRESNTLADGAPNGLEQR